MKAHDIEFNELHYSVLCVTQLYIIHTLHTGYTDKTKAPDFDYLFRVAYLTAHAMSKVHTISMHVVL